MRIAVSSTSEGLDSETSPVFGRCAHFIIVETEDEKIKSSNSIENECRRNRGGVGITAGELMGNEEVDAVITTNIGPRAFSVLNELGIKVYSGIEASVEENVKKLLKGGLEEMTSSQPGHYGMRKRHGRK